MQVCVCALYRNFANRTTNIEKYKVANIDLSGLSPDERVDKVREGLRRHESCNFTCGDNCFKASAAQNGPSDVLLHLAEGDRQYPGVPDYAPLDPPSTGENS